MILRIKGFLCRHWRKLITRIIYNPALKKAGMGIVINSPFRVTGINHISIGDKTIVGYKSWLAAGNETGNPQPELTIGNECHIGNFNHIYATDRVVIEDYVLTADKVYITDNLHTYLDINVPIWQQPVKHKKDVTIGEGSWLGENVCVVCANVGKHCVVGANSVVTKDIPDYCVAVGIPARIIKRYDVNKQEWKDER